jgi:uncharacterized phage-associated protein
LAAHILHAAHRKGIDVTNLKLQKLLYYSQGWHIAITGQEIFADPIEAWVHGPVVASVFGEYKHNRWSALHPPDNQEPHLEIGFADYPLHLHIDRVLDAYGKFSGPQLEALTHEEDPWVEARRGLPPDRPSRERISVASLKSYFEPRLVRG